MNCAEYLRLNSHPSVAECDGDYHHDSRKNLLQWNLPIIDGANKAGSMEFSVPASIPGDFFPVQVNMQNFTFLLGKAEIESDVCS